MWLRQQAVVSVQHGAAADVKPNEKRRPMRADGPGLATAVGSRQADIAAGWASSLFCASSLAHLRWRSNEVRGGSRSERRQESRGQGVQVVGLRSRSLEECGYAGCGPMYKGLKCQKRPKATPEASHDPHVLTGR